MLNKKPDVAVGKSSCSQTTMEDHPAGKCRMADGGRQRLWRKLVLSEWEISARRSCGSLLNKYKTEDITFTDLNRRRVAQIEKETGVKAVDTKPGLCGKCKIYRISYKTAVL